MTTDARTAKSAMATAITRPAECVIPLVTVPLVPYTGHQPTDPERSSIYGRCARYGKVLDHYAVNGGTTVNDPGPWWEH